MAVRKDRHRRSLPPPPAVATPPVLGATNAEAEVEEALPIEESVEGLPPIEADPESKAEVTLPTEAASVEAKKSEADLEAMVKVAEDAVEEEEKEATGGGVKSGGGLVLEARFDRTAYAADREHEAAWMDISVKAMEAGPLECRPGLDLVILLDTSQSMVAGGWLAACSKALRYMLQRHLHAHDDVCLLCFDADSQAPSTQRFIRADEKGRQELEGMLLGLEGMSFGNPSPRVGLRGALQQGLAMLQRPLSSSSAMSTTPCLLLLTDSARPCIGGMDTLAFVHSISTNEATLVPRLAMSAVGLGPTHDANLLHALVHCNNINDGGLGGCYLYAARPEDAAVAVAEGLGPWLGAVVARDVMLTAYSGEEGEVQFEDVIAWDQIMTRSRQLLRLDLGALAGGGERHTLVKVKLSVVQQPGFTAGSVIDQDVAALTLRYRDVTGGGSGILREERLQVTAVRSRSNSSSSRRRHRAHLRTASSLSLSVSSLSIKEDELDESGGKGRGRGEEEDQDPVIWFERARVKAAHVLWRLKAWADGTHTDLTNGPSFLKAHLKRFKQRHSQQERHHRDRWAINDISGEAQDPLPRINAWRAALDAHAVLLEDLQAVQAAVAAGKDAPALLLAAWYTHAERKGGIVRADRGLAYGGVGRTGAVPNCQGVLDSLLSGKTSGAGGDTEEGLLFATAVEVESAEAEADDELEGEEAKPDGGAQAAAGSPRLRRRRRDWGRRWGGKGAEQR